MTEHTETSTPSPELRPPSRVVSSIVYVEPVEPVPYTGPSRVRTKSGTRIDTGGTDMTPAVDAVADGFEQIWSVESYIEETIDEHLNYLASIADLRDRAKPGLQRWQYLLGGDIDEVSGGEVVHASGNLAMNRAGVPTKRVGVRRALDTGYDERQLERDRPEERYKFYHSFSDSERATKYVEAVVKRAYEVGITLSTKSFDHQYDGINLYTNHLPELYAIIQEVYPDYIDAFGETEHFLQGPVEGIDPKHIGWVQEPKKSKHSHSGRMGILGGELDASGLSREGYTRGCEKAGVRPEAPWLLSEEAVDMVRVAVAEKYAGTEWE